MRTSMLFRKQLLGVDCTLPHDLSLFSIMIYSTTSPAEAIESNVLAYFKHDLKSYILNNKFVAFIFESSTPIRIDCFEFVAFAFGIRRRFGLPSGQPNGYGYCALGRNTPPLFRLLRPRAQYASAVSAIAPKGAIRLHGRAMCSGASALARIRTAFFRWQPCPKRWLRNSIDTMNDHSTKPYYCWASSPRQRRVMNEFRSILSPLGLMASRLGTAEG